MEAVPNSFDSITGTYYKAKRYTIVDSIVTRSDPGLPYSIPTIGVGIIGIFIRYNAVKQTDDAKKKIPIKEISLDLGTTALSRYNFTDGVEFLKVSYKNNKDVFNYSRGNDDEFLKNLVPVLMGSVIDPHFEDFYPYPIRSNINYALTVELDDNTDGISIDVITQHVTGDALHINSLYFPTLKNFTFPSDSGKLLQLTGSFGSINSIMIIDGQHDGIVNNLIIRIGGIEVINVKPEFSTQKNGLRFSNLFTHNKIRNDKHVVTRISTERCLPIRITMSAKQLTLLHLGKVRR